LLVYLREVAMLTRRRRSAADPLKRQRRLRGHGARVASPSPISGGPVEAAAEGAGKVAEPHLAVADQRRTR